MNARSHAPWIAGAFTFGLLVTGLSIASATASWDSQNQAQSDPTPVPDAKEEHLDGVEVVDPDDIGQFWDGNLLAEGSDRGSRADVQAVKQAIPELVTLKLAAGRLPATLLDASNTSQLEYAESATARAAQRSLLEQAVPADQVEDLSREVSEGLRVALETPGADWLYIDNRFLVFKWQGVQVDVDTALALVVAAKSYREPDGEWVQEEPNQYRFSLVRQATAKYGWLLADSTAIPLMDAGVTLDSLGVEK